MFWEIIDENYSKENGIASVVIKTDLGTIRTEARLHPEDVDVASEFFGLDLAHFRAYKEYYKRAYQLEKKNYNIVKEFVSRCASMKNFKDGDGYKSVYHQLNICEKKLNKAKIKYVTVLETEKIFIKSREITNNYLREKNKVDK